MTLKVCIVGPTNSGKTYLVERLITGKKYREIIYRKTFGAEIHKMDFKTNIGTITLDITDCSGGKYIGLFDAYVKNANVIIFLFDSSSIQSFSELKNWMKMSSLSSKKFIIVGNKSEIRNISSPTSEGDENIHYISVKTGNTRDLKQPFLYAIRKIYGDKINLI